MQGQLAGATGLRTEDSESWLVATRKEEKEDEEDEEEGRGEAEEDASTVSRPYS